MLKSLMVGSLMVLLGTQSGVAEDVTFYPFDENGEMAKYPFSRAVRVGDLLFLSGEVGVNPETDVLVDGGMLAEARQALTNIRASLALYDLTMKDVVKCQVFLDDMDQWGDFNTVYREFFERPFPARAAVGADGLALGALVEVDCIAAFADEAEQ